MKTLKDYNQEFIDKMGNAINSVNVLEEDAGYVIKFWNIAIKQVLENVKPIRKNNILYVLNYEADLDSNIKNILEG